MDNQLLKETDNFKTYYIAVRPYQKPERLDSFVADSIKDLSRNKVQELIARELVILNGKPAVKASYKVSPNDMLEVLVPSLEPLHVEPENIPLDVIYEDDDLIVINKKPNFVVHPAVGNRTGTLVNALAHRCTTLSDVGGEYRPGIVHRLDKDTSGAIIAAKNNHAHNIMARKFEYRKIEKYYMALVWGKFPQAEGSYTKYIGRHKRDRQKYAAYSDERFGKSAETRYTVVEEYPLITLVKIQLMTGRTHQIRVHFSDDNHPVVGDVTYGGRTKRLPSVSPADRSTAIEVLENIDRQALHCYQMKFEHPTSCEAITVTAPLPDDMNLILNLLKNKRTLNLRKFKE